MKRLLIFIGILLPSLAFPQAYVIDMHAVANGGGTAIGGAYALSGTIGQVDASGAMAGGSYSLTGGFWSIYAIRTPGAPPLRIVATPTNTVVVAWPTSSSPFSLQQNGTISSTNWMAVTNPPIVVGTENQVTVTLSSETMFFRLKSP